MDSKTCSYLIILSGVAVIWLNAVTVAHPINKDTSDDFHSRLTHLRRIALHKRKLQLLGIYPRIYERIGQLVSINSPAIKPSRHGYGRMFETKWPTMGHSRNRLESVTSKDHPKRPFDRIRVEKTTPITSQMGNIATEPTIPAIIRHTTHRNPTTTTSRPHFVNVVTPASSDRLNASEVEPTKSVHSFDGVSSTPIPATLTFATVQPQPNYTTATERSGALDSEQSAHFVLTTVKIINQTRSSIDYSGTTIASSVAITTTERPTTVESKENNDNSTKLRAKDSITVPTVIGQLEATTAATPSITESVDIPTIEFSAFKGKENATTATILLDDIQSTGHSDIGDIGIDLSTSTTAASTTFGPIDATNATTILTTILSATTRSSVIETTNSNPLTESERIVFTEHTTVTTKRRNSSSFTLPMEEIPTTVSLERLISTTTVRIPSNDTQTIDESSVDNATSAFEYQASTSSPIVSTTFDSIVTEAEEDTSKDEQIALATTSQIEVTMNITTPLTESVENVSFTPPKTLPLNVTSIGRMEHEPVIGSFSEDPNATVKSIQAIENITMDEALDDTKYGFTITSTETTEPDLISTNTPTNDLTTVQEAFTESAKMPNVDDPTTTMTSDYSTTESYLDSLLSLEDMSTTWVPVPATTQGPERTSPIFDLTGLATTPTISSELKNTENLLIAQPTDAGVRFDSGGNASEPVTFAWTPDVIASTSRPADPDATLRTHETVDFTTAASVTAASTNFSAIASSNVTNEPETQSSKSSQGPWTHAAVGDKFDPFDYEESGVPAIQASR